MLFLAVEGPGSKLVVRGVGHGAGNQDALAGRKRKDAIVFEKYGGLFCRFLCGGKVLRRILYGGGCFQVYIRLFKQPQKHFYTEDVPYGVVYCGNFDLSALNQFFEVRKEAVSHHVHINPGIHCLSGHVLAVRAEAVGNHFSHGVPVRYNKAVEAPFAAEDVLDHEGVARGRNAVVVIERGHQSHCSGLYSSLEGRQVDVAELTLGKVCAIVVTAAFAGAVTHEMLDAGRHGGGVKLLSLIAADHGFRHAGIKVSVFSAAFCNAAPAGVTSNIQHGREGPPHALCSGLYGCYSGPSLNQTGVKGSCQTQGNGENSVETVNHVTGHKKRNAQTGLFHADALVLVYLDRVHLVQDGAYLAAAEGIGIIGHVPAYGNLVHLAYLFREGHL